MAVVPSHLHRARCRRVGRQADAMRARLGGRGGCPARAHRIESSSRLPSCHATGHVHVSWRCRAAQRACPALSSDPLPLPRRPTGVCLPCRLLVTGSRRCWGIGGEGETRSARDGGVLDGLLGCRIPRSSAGFVLTVTQDNPMPCCDTAGQHDGLLATEYQLNWSAVLAYLPPTPTASAGRHRILSRRTTILIQCLQ